jgi:hypothetical protein
MALNNYECAILLQTIMRQTFSDSQLQSVSARLDQSKTQNPKSKIELRSPVHVVYGGAHLFKADTPQKLGKLALKSLETYAPNFAEFAQAMPNWKSVC